MQTHIRKWGNSLGLRIPTHIAKQLKLHEGSSITLEIEEGKMIIQAPTQYQLEEMLKEITPQNRHHQILEDVQKGNEEW
jgi:antitoxin MazE